MSGKPVKSDCPPAFPGDASRRDPDSPSQHLNRQALKCLRVPLEVLTDRRVERLLSAGHLRRRIVRKPFGAVEPPARIPQ